MDPSDSHQPLDSTTITNTYVPEDISPLTTQTLNELNSVEPQVEPLVQPQVEPHAASETALVPAQPSSNRRAYTDMIYDAVVALNEPAGSSRWAISRHVRRTLNPNVPDAHEDLITHHLQVMKNCGILTMVRKSYKLADSSPPGNVAVGTAAVDAGLVASGSEIPPTNTGPLDMLAVSAAAVDTGLVVASGSEIPPTSTGSLDVLAVTASGSASQPLKRGRGRPPKPKTEAPQQQQPLDAQPISQALQPSINVEPSAVQPRGEQLELPVTNPSPVVKESAKKGPGRPRKDGSGPSVSSANLAVMMKRRGWPSSSRASGRQRKPISVPAPASVIPVVANGAGRTVGPRRGGSGGGVDTLAPAGAEAMAVAAVMKRGPGRPPKRGRGRTAGRPRQNTPMQVTRGTGTTQESAYGDLKRKLDLAREKAKELLNVLDAGIGTGDNQAVTQARQELDELIQMLIVEQQAMEEVQAEEAAAQIEAETQGMQLGQGSGGGGEQAQILTLSHTLILTQPQPQTLTQPQPQTLPQLQPETLTLNQPEPQILPQLAPQAPPDELEPLPELEPLLELEPLPLTSPSGRSCPSFSPIQKLR